MSLFKRGNVYWAYVWINGIRHHKSTGTPNRRKAELIEQQFKEELNLRRHHLKELEPNLTFGELAARFLANGDAKAWHLDRLKVLLPYFADIPISHISKSTAREYRKYRHKQRKLSETTVNRDLEALRHLLYWALDEGVILANPLSRLKFERERRKKRPVLSLEEERLLLNAASPHLAQIITVALDTGMRRGEILAQLWEDIDFARDLLNVTHSKTPEGEAREIPLTTRLRDLFLNIRKMTGPVCTYKDKTIHRIKTAWKATLRRAAIRPLRFHDLRHTFNTRLMEAGVMQEIRKALMGHSSGEDINSIYTHVELPAKREAVRKLEQWVKTQTLTPKGELNDRTEINRPHTSPAHGHDLGHDPNHGAQAVEEEDPGRSSPRPNREGAGPSYGARRGAEGGEAPAAEARGREETP